jgi:Fic family protein
MVGKSKFGSLQASPVGQVMPVTGHDARFGEDYAVEAFIPDPLPDNLDLAASAWMIISEAMTELGRLDSAASLIPNPHLVARVATRREAVGTSALEGTYADLTELFAAEAVPRSTHDADVPANVREVMNYANAAENAYEWIVDRPITLGLICAMQAEIVRGTASDGADAGSIRTTQVFIGAANRRVGEARFVPPPPGDRLRAMVDQWLAWVSAPAPSTSIPLLARIAMAHYQFETLHPFTDGNGRVGRLVAALQILADGVLRVPVLAISPWLEERSDEYRDHLLAVSSTGDWQPWIEFFAQAVRDESKAGHDRIMRLLSLRDDIGHQVRSALPRARLALDIAHDLIAYPVLSVADSQQRHGRTNQANRDAISALVDLGVLEPYGSARYDRLFWCRRVFQAIGP